MKHTISDFIVYNIIKNLDRMTFTSIYAVHDATDSMSYRENKIHNELFKISNAWYKPNNDSDNSSRLFDTSLNKKVHTDFVTKYEKLFPKISTSELEFDSRVKALCELLNLDEDESKFINYNYQLTRLTTCDGSIVSGILRNEDDGKSRIHAKVSGIDEDKFIRIMNGETFSLKNRILIKQDGYSHRTNCLGMIFDPKIASILGLKTLTKQKIQEILFPTKIETDLELKDYHEVDDIKILVDLVDNAIKNKTKSINILLWGVPGTGKTELVALLAKKHKWNLKIIGDNDELNEEAGRGIRLASLKIAQNMFASNNDKSVILFDEAEDVTHKIDINDTFSKSYLNKTIDTTPIPIIWTTNDISNVDQAFLRRMSFSIHFKVPPKKHREKIWNKYNSKYELGLDDDIIKELSTTYDIVPALINNTARIVKNSNLNLDQTKKVIQNLDTTMNWGFERKLEGKKSKVSQFFNVDLANCDLDLDDLTKRLINTKQKNWSLCLFGPSGTGKSEYARYVAKEMGMNVVYKKASDLISMWVGETEKNIAKAFEQANDEESLLIFDEADSFLRSRAGADKSWEVTQVNEMLTQMESTKMPFVCTTNLMESLDAASLRRFTFKMKFNYMKQKQIMSAFKIYFGGEASKDLLNMDILTLGDFASVKKKIEILDITDENKISKMLIEECEIKPEFKKKIGF